MTPSQREDVLQALRHGRDSGDAELEALLVDDLAALEPLIDKWIAQAALDEVLKYVLQRITRIENHLLEKFGEAP
jgi:hypothetical protein